MKSGVIPLRRPQDKLVELSDEALVAGTAVGDRAALATLFERHHRAVHRFLSRLRERDVEDLVQATFLEVRRAAARFDRRSAVLTWLLAIAANVARYHRRGEKKQRAILAGVAAEPEPASPPGPDQTAESRQLMALISRALTALPHDLRVVFVMCDLEQVPGVEAARVLGLREGTLWRRLHDARRRLRRALEEKIP